MITGTKIGRYEIRGQIGSGGMGVVYSAVDTDLHRKVALKVLSKDVANDKERILRFEQEAKATSALNHPNILTVFDFGNHDGSPYIVAELLEGEELTERLTEGAIPLRKVVAFARQIVDGLAAAHEKRIVHRDLKPANVFITQDERVKILDFGLAKLREPLETHGTEDATFEAITTPGLVMGTVGYMSPEQVRGQPADHRSDIFSFGVILHEMITGRRAFHRSSMAETMAAILKEEPEELTSSNPSINPSLERIVRRCLEKKPDLRFQSTRDLSFALDALTVTSNSTGSNLTAEARAIVADSDRQGVRKPLPWIAAGLMLVGLIITVPFAILYLRQPAKKVEVTRFSILQPKGTTAAARPPTVAISPDGRRIVFGTIDGSRKRQLWMRSFDSFDSVAIAVTDGGSSPFWSPDGRFIAFFTDDKLKKYDTESGVIQTICPATSSFFGGSWSSEGVIVFGNDSGKGLLRVSASGCSPEPATELDTASGEESHSGPDFLPDGKHFLFLAAGGDKQGIYVGSLDSKERKLLFFDGLSRPYFAQPGFILYAPDRTTVLARAFDADRLEMTGDPFPVADNVEVSGNGNARISVSANGVLAFVQGLDSEMLQLTWRDRSGGTIGTVGPVAQWLQMDLSPDAHFAAVTRDETTRNRSLWLIDLEHASTTNYKSDGDNSFPVWSPDGSQFVFSANRDGVSDPFLKPVNSNLPETMLADVPSSAFPSSWSPDGKNVIVSMKRDIWTIPVDGDHTPKPLIHTKASERLGRVSPDGKWIAYQSDEPGQDEIYVSQYPEATRSWRISNGGGVNPQWRGDGKELYFISGGELVAVSVGAGDDFQFGPPQSLFKIETREYVASKDGKRFLTGVVTEKAPPSPINVVVNWTAGIKK